jgi:peroxiredoxin
VLPVNDGVSWSLLSSNNLCDWIKAGDDSLNCFIQVTDKLNIYTSSQNTGICKISNNYSTISTDGTIDYEVTANQYQQTGVVVSSGDRLYAKNNGPCRMSFTVWGYEG